MAEEGKRECERNAQEAGLIPWDAQDQSWPWH